MFVIISASRYMNVSQFTVITEKDPLILGIYVTLADLNLAQ